MDKAKGFMISTNDTMGGYTNQTRGQVFVFHDVLLSIFFILKSFMGPFVKQWNLAFISVDM